VIPKPFASLMFFERGIQSSTRHRKLRYLLLFALRMALVALVVLAFANPFIHRTTVGASGRLLVVVVDNSYSMHAGNRFADAKQAAERVLAGKASGQKAQVMALGAELQVLTQPVEDAGTLRSAVESIQQGDSKGNYGELGRGLRALAETVHGPVELHLFSDMQHSQVPTNFADIVLPQNVKLTLHSVAPSGAPGPNWTVENVVAPAQISDPKDKRVSRVQAVVSGIGTPAATKTVSLIVNGKTVASKQVDVPANGRVKVELEPLDVPYGFSKCEIRVSGAGGPDAFPQDDASVFAVRRRDPEKVAFLHSAGDTRSQLYYGAALAAAAETSFELQPVNVEQSNDLDPTRYAYVVLADTGQLPSIVENALVQYVKKGGSVLIAAGTASAHHGKLPVLGDDIEEGKYYTHDATGYANVEQVDSTHPVLGEAAANQPASSSASGGQETGQDAGGWPDMKVYYASRIDADKAKARVLVRLSDGTPLLMDQQLGEGHVLVFASGLENVTNDLPLQPGFVPFVDRSARYLSGDDRLGGSRMVDSFVQLRTAERGAGGAGVEVIDPDGKRPLSLTQAASVQSFQLTKAGFYQLRFANGKDAMVGVNPDRRESDLAVIPEDMQKLWAGSGSEGAPASNTGAALAAKETPYSLWWWVMLFALAVAVAESIVASGYLGTQREEA
jgi:hypothetical protein